MSLRSKIILILSGVVALYAAFDNGLLRFMASRSFEGWELEEADESLREVLGYIQDEERDVEGKCRLLASWRGLQDFAQGRAPGFAEENLTPALLEESDVDLIYVLDGQGTVLWGRIEAPGSEERIELREFPSGSLLASHPVFAVADDGQDWQASLSGLFMTELMPMLLARRSIPAIDGEDGDRSLASVIVGRFFDPDLRADLGRRATVDLDITGVDSAAVDRDLVDEVTSAAPGDFVTRVGEDDRLELYTTMSDLRRRPSMLLRASLERDVVARGKRAVNYALLSTLATALLILLVLLRLLQGIVVRPLSALTDTAVVIGQTDDTSRRVGMDRTDEIGQLSQEFDRMLEKLERSRAELVKTARMAGMSEIATGVLHNVGNVLNSVNVSSTMVRKRTQQLAVDDLERVLGILREHADDLGEFVTKDERGKHLVPFLDELATALEKQKRAILEELENLGTGIEHIADLVRSQQSYAGTRGVFELASLPQLVEAAVKICDQAYAACEGIEIVREYEELPQVHVDKHKLMEILVNLIQNARQALEGVEEPDRRVVLRVGSTPAGKARIEVADNGTGIPAENLTKIFHHGFTTKDGGHGFGLHVSANAATEMGASLSAKSDGPGKGATFVLHIPMELARTARAA